MPHLVWTPIFKGNEVTGEIESLTFIMYTDESRTNMEYAKEAKTDFYSLLNVTEEIIEQFGDNFSTMVDTGAISLVETIQCSVDGIKGCKAWEEHLQYLQSWRDTQ